VRDKRDRLAEGKANPGMFEAMRKSIARKARNQKAPYNCIAAVEAATTAQSFEAGLETERLLFSELENSGEAKALRYAFFAEREVAKIPGAPKDYKPPRVKTAAVVGAGTMGGGIAMSFADHGIPVKILDATRDVLDKGLQRVRDNYAVSVKRGSITQAQMDERLPRIQPGSTRS
jgi:3-hydroxyacyl-CoA dehydrogenase